MASSPRPTARDRRYAGAPRTRRHDGRPEQARPRDRTGRPLPYDTTEVALTEDVEPATIEEALTLGLDRWEQQRFFEAHELLEHVWHAAPAQDRDLWQGVIQVAVGAVHLQRGNPKGAAALLDRAATRLEAYPDGHCGIEVVGLRTRARQLIAELERDPEGVDPSGLPATPATAEGAWFGAEAAATGPPDEPTPVPAEPAWRRPPEGRG